MANILNLQVRTLEETEKISRALPSLQQSTSDALRLVAGIIDSVRSFSTTKEDIFNVKENVDALRRLVLGK